MIWNPTSNIGTDANGRLAFGGMHYIYIFNKNGVLATDIPIYDNGVRVDSLLNTLKCGCETECVQRLYLDFITIGTRRKSAVSY